MVGPNNIPKPLADLISGATGVGSYFRKEESLIHGI